MKAAGSIILIGLSLAPGLGGLYRPGQWYLSLELPPFTPPAWVFPAAWSLLYCLLALGAVLAWLGARSGRGKFPWTVFLVQGALNFFWSFFFFGRHNIIFSLIELLALILAVAVLSARFFSLRRAAGWALIPYLAWLGFALVLNYSIFLENPA